MHIVIDKHGNPWGPFDKSYDAAKWAQSKWPDEKWEVVALRPPD